MVSPFQEAAAQAVADVDDVFAEALSLQFRAGGASDPDRPDQIIQARLNVHDQSGTNISGGRSSEWHSEVAEGGALMTIALAAYPDLDLRKGDVVTALDRAGEPEFRVLRIDGRDATRLFVELTDK